MKMNILKETIDFYQENTCEGAPLETFFKADQNGVVLWQELERKLGVQQYGKFRQWMRGQTCVEKGAYIGDVIKFLTNHQISD